MEHRIRMTRQFVAFLLATCLLFSCTPSGEKIEVIEQPSSKAVVKVAVSDECSIVAKELLDDFGVANSTSFEFTETHSPQAKNHVVQGSADLAIVTRRMTPANDEEFNYIPFAYNGIIFLADSSAGVMELTRKQVKDIFSGAVKNWKKVGGNDVPITVITRPPNSSALGAVAKFLGVGSVTFGPDVKTFFAETNLVAQSATKRMSGFFAFVLISGTRSARYKGIPLIIEGVEPVTTNVSHKPYPVSLEIAFITKPDYAGDVKDLIDFIYTNRGVHKLAALGLVPVSENMTIADCHCRGRDGMVVPSTVRNLGLLTLGIVPELGVTVQDKRYRKLAEVIAEELNLVIRLRHFESYKQVVGEFRRGTIEAAFVGSYVYGLLREDPRVVPLARPDRDGKSEYRGVLIALKDGGFRKFKDLRGKRVSYVPYTTAGELFMKGLATSKGFSPEQFFSETVPVLSHEESLNVLVDGKVDGAFVKNLVLDRIIANHTELSEKIVVLETSGSVPENALVVTDEISQMFGGQFRSVLLNMGESVKGKGALKEMGADKFVPTAHEDYENLYQMAKEAGENI